MAQGPEAWQRRMKEEKERERAVKNQTAELHQNYRNKGLHEADTKLAALKQEERRKLQETREMHSKFKKLEIGEDEKKLSNLKQEERRRVQETEQMYHSHQHNTIKESDMKLSFLRQEERKRMQEHEASLRNYSLVTSSQSVEEKDTFRRTNSARNLQASSDDEEMPSKDELKTEIKKGSAVVQAVEIPRFSRRSSIGTTVNTMWTAKAKEKAPLKEESAHVTSVSGVSKSFTNSPRAESKSPPAMDATEPSPKAEPHEPTVDHKATNMQAARNMFAKNSAASPLLPPENGTYSAAKTSPGKKETTEPQSSPEADSAKTVARTSPIVEPPPSPTPTPAAAPELAHKENGKGTKEEEEGDVEEEEQEITAEDIEAEAIASAASVVRLDVLFSFGLLTSSDEPVFFNYMNAVELIVKRTILNNPTLAEYVWYDPVYPAFVQDYRNDDSYKDPSGRGNVRRLLVIAAIPIFLRNGITVKQAREGVCVGLQGAITTGEFIRLAKTSHTRKDS